MPPTISIRSPELLPRASFFHGVRTSDHLLLVDTLPYRRRTRFTRAILPGGARISIPVTGKGRLCDLRFPDDPRWRAKLLRALDHAFPGISYHQALREDLQDLLEGASSPSGLCSDILTLHLRGFRIRTPVVLASEFDGKATPGTASPLGRALEALGPTHVEMEGDATPPADLSTWSERTGGKIMRMAMQPEPPLAYTVLAEEGPGGMSAMTQLERSTGNPRSWKI